MRTCNGFGAALVALAACAVIGLASTASAGGLATQDLNAGLTPPDLVNALLGGGVVVNNIQYTGANAAAGTFTGGSGIIGFESGIILSSGNIANVVGPNTMTGATGDNGGPGDADLSAIVGQPTFDATVLEFDFVPLTSVVTFSYVFASEEYNEYVNQFNDVFAFFVNGVNQALVPGTTTVVSINTVNLSVNPAYYINNDDQSGGAPLNTQMDGVTVVLTVTAQVNPGVANHIKLAISDTLDEALDSVVFLAAGSFTSSNISLTPLTATNPVGTNHTVHATVTVDGQPTPGVHVNFNVTAGPHAGAFGSAFTQLDGVATWSYLGTSEGTDTIQASADIGGDGELNGTSLQVSNPVYKTWEGGALTPRALKQAALPALQADFPTGNKAIDKSLAGAISDIQLSLQDRYWADDSHLTIIGKRVFNDEFDAAKNLLKLLANPSVDPLLAADAQGALDKLAAADEGLALVALAEAMAGAGPGKKAQNELRKAEQSYNAGAAAQAAGKVLDAISAFKDSWQHSQMALGRNPK